MKAGTTLVLAVSALVVFAVACKDPEGTTVYVKDSEGTTFVSKYDVDQTLSGKSFTIEVDEASGQSKTVQELTATGKPGSADVLSAVVFKTHDKNVAQQIAAGSPDPRCPNQKPDKYYPYPADIVSVSWVQSYNDGSSFTGEIDKGTIPQSAVCTDGARFYVKVSGPVTEGSGPRFKNVVGGNWNAEVWIDEKSIATGSVRANFEFPQN